MQLLALAGVHFLVDMFGNMLPSILPVIREEFALSLSLGGFVLASLTLTSNFVQVLTGHMRAKKTRPLFLQLGLVLAVGICLLSVLPRSGLGISLVILFGIISSNLALMGIFIVYGASIGILEPTERAWVSELSSTAKRGSAFGFYHAAKGFGALPASLIFGFLWSRFGQSAAFFTGAGLAVAALCIILFIKPKN